MKGEAIRLLRSNIHAPTFTNTICIFKKHLLCRKYPKVFIERILDRITHDLRPNYTPTTNPSPNPSSSLSPSPRPPPRLVTTYSAHFVHLNSFLTKHWQLISEDPALSPSPRQVCYRRNPTLSCSLVRAALRGYQGASLWDTLAYWFLYTVVVCLYPCVVLWGLFGAVVISNLLQMGGPADLPGELFSSRGSGLRLSWAGLVGTAVPVPALLCH